MIKIIGFILLAIVIFILVVILQVDIKMTLRYRNGPKTKARIISSMGEKMSANYGARQPRTRYYVYEAEYNVNGRHTGKLYDTKKREIGEVVEVPYWIEKDGTQELTPRTYHDRFIRFLCMAVVGIIIAVAYILYMRCFA